MRSVLRLLVLSAALGAGIQTLAGDAFRPLTVREVKVGGEIGRRIGVTISNNLMVLDADKEFLAPFQARSQKGGYIGLGKLLLAAVRFAAYSQDPRVLERKNHLVERTLALQDAEGYIGLCLPANRVNSLWDVHEAGYIVYGLLADYEFFQNRQALAGARKLADYLLAHWSAVPADWVARTGVDPYVAVTGLERTLLALARATGETRYRDFVLRERALAGWNMPIVVGRRRGIEGHIYAYMTRSLAMLELYRERPAPGLLAPARRAVEFLTHGEGMTITGGAGQWEIWTGDQDGRGAHAESCATAYQLRVYDSLLRLGGEARYGDLIERTVYNTLFAAQSPDGRRIRYYSPLEGPRRYHPRDTYCCPGNYRRIVSELPEMIWYRWRNGVAVNLYTASEMHIEGLRIRQETAYPSDGTVVLRLDPERPTRFPLRLRIPGWARGASLRVNAQPGPSVTPGTFAQIERLWKAGDSVRLEFPMPARFVRGRQQQAGRVAVMRGPLVFCLNPAQRADLKGLDAADLSRLIIDTAGIETISSDAVRPGGVALRAGAWKPGYTTNPKPEFQIVLTEFPDPEGQATYFRVRDLRAAVNDELAAAPVRSARSGSQPPSIQ